MCFLVALNTNSMGFLVALSTQSMDAMTCVDVCALDLERTQKSMSSYLDQQRNPCHDTFNQTH